MNEHLGSIYQSGQRVPISGLYEVVGVNSALSIHSAEGIRQLHQDEYFPSYQGWDVCWRLIPSAVQEPDEARPPTHGQRNQGHP
jgi:hypothetical protein